MKCCLSKTTQAPFAPRLLNLAVIVGVAGIALISGCAAVPNPNGVAPTTQDPNLRGPVSGSAWKARTLL